MYYGKTTKKLEQLYAEYNKIWGCDPDCYEELEYGENAYKEFMKDIRKALKMRVKLTDIYPPVDDEF